jgi:signal transduction histidine kinase
VFVLASYVDSVQEQRAAELEDAVIIGQSVAAVVQAFAQDLETTLLAAGLAISERSGPLDQASLGPYLTALVSEYRLLRTMFVTDLGGQVIAASGGQGIGTDVSGRPYIQALQAGAETIWVDQLIGLETGEFTVAYARAIKDAGGSTRAFLVAAFYPDRLVERLPVRLPPDAAILMINRQGTVMHASDFPDLPIPRRDVASSGFIARTLQGEVVSFTDTALRPGVELRFGALVPVIPPGWVVGFTRPQAPLDEVLRARLLRDFLATTLVMLLAAGLIALLARRLTQPLATLAETAAAIARGERPTVPPLESDVEVMQLAAGMQAMSAAVAEREDALREAARQRAAVADLGQRALAGLELDELLREAALVVSATLEVEYVAVLELALSGRELRLRAGVGWPDGAIGEVTVSAGLESQAGFTLQSIGPVIVEDLRTETRFSAPLLAGRSVVSGLTVLIPGRERPFGVLGAHTTRHRTFTRDDLNFMQAMANVLAAAIERRHSEDVLRFLAEASEVLTSSMEYEQRVATVARLAVPRLADWCTVNVVDEQGHLRRVGTAHVDPAKEPLLNAMRAHFPPDPGASHGLPKVIRTGQPELHPEVTPEFVHEYAPHAEHRHLLETLGFSSYMSVPLIARGKILGAISFASMASGRRFTSEDLALAEELASRAALAIDNARLYEDVQQAIKMRDDYLATLSHDLRTPLTAIKGSAQFGRRMAERLQRPELEQVLEAFQRIDETATRMAELMNELLDLSRLDTGQPLPLDRRATDVVALVQRIAVESQRLTARHRIVVERPETELIGNWDGPRLERVMNNLIGNAIKYSPNGGDVTVSITRSDDAALLHVRDRGIGIPPADLAHVFDRFYRARNVEGRITGTGIGLAASRQVVDQHGGSISVDSEEGVGTTVTVRLPLT